MEGLEKEKRSFTQPRMDLIPGVCLIMWYNHSQKILAELAQAYFAGVIIFFGL